MLITNCATVQEMAKCSATSTEEILKCRHRRGTGSAANIEQDGLCMHCAFRSPVTETRGSTCNSASAHDEALIIEVMKRNITVSAIVESLVKLYREAE